MKCRDHLKYKGVNKPRTKCIRCWIMWLNNHKDSSILGGDILSILELVNKEILKLHKLCNNIAISTLI